MCQYIDVFYRVLFDKRMKYVLALDFYGTEVNNEILKIKIALCHNFQKFRLNFGKNQPKFGKIEKKKIGEIDQNLGKSLSEGPKNRTILCLKGSIFDFPFSIFHFPFSIFDFQLGANLVPPGSIERIHS